MANQEVFNQARQTFEALKSSPDFQHGGENSRGIEVDTLSLTRKMVVFAVGKDCSDRVKSTVADLAALIKTISDFGSYVRIAGGEGFLCIAVRGKSGKLSEPPSERELLMDMVRMDGFEVNIFSDKPSWLSCDADLLRVGDRRYDDIIKERWKALTGEEQEFLVGGLVDIVKREVKESGEFIDL